MGTTKKSRKKKQELLNAGPEGAKHISELVVPARSVKCLCLCEWCGGRNKKESRAITALRLGESNFAFFD